jgi:hypothetical protein
MTLTFDMLGVRLMNKIPPRNGRHLPLIQKSNLVFLIGFVIARFFLPLSNSQRWMLVPNAAVLVGANLALTSYMKGVSMTLAGSMGGS